MQAGGRQKLKNQLPRLHILEGILKIWNSEFRTIFVKYVGFASLNQILLQALNSIKLSSNRENTKNILNYITVLLFMGVEEGKNRENAKRLIWRIFVSKRKCWMKPPRQSPLKLNCIHVFFEGRNGNFHGHHHDRFFHNTMPVKWS